MLSRQIDAGYAYVDYDSTFYSNGIKKPYSAWHWLPDSSIHPYMIDVVLPGYMLCSETDCSKPIEQWVEQQLGYPVQM